MMIHHLLTFENLVIDQIDFIIEMQWKGFVLLQSQNSVFLRGNARTNIFKYSHVKGFGFPQTFLSEQYKHLKIIENALAASFWEYFSECLRIFWRMFADIFLYYFFSPLVTGLEIIDQAFHTILELLPILITRTLTHMPVSIHYNAPFPQPKR